MNDVEVVLPPHAGRAEKALVQPIIGSLSFEFPIRDLWNPHTAPAQTLPWLAWALSVDDWDPDWSEERKREVIAASVELHRIKGTLRSVKLALETMGYGDAKVIEDRDLPRIGDPNLLIGGDFVIGDGNWVIGPSNPHWADYWVELMQPVNRRDADLLASRLLTVAPARCRLRGIRLTGVYFAIGDDLWLIGDDVSIGGVYIYEV